jgi:hypothetical protein
MDSDLHVIEPQDLWKEYLDPRFRGRIETVPASDGQMRARVDGKVLPPYAGQPERDRAWSFRTAAPAWKRISRSTPPKVVLEAMDVEGIDVGILFRTWATHAINIDGLEPAFPAAMSRAWNRWIADFCPGVPGAIQAVGPGPLQDIELAVGEARFAVGSLGRHHARAAFAPHQRSAPLRPVLRPAVGGGAGDGRRGVVLRQNPVRRTNC